MKRILLVLLSVGTLTNVFAQSKTTETVNLYITNPLGVNSKAGFRLEYKHNNLGIVGGYTNYYGEYPGNQFSLELRNYIPLKKSSSLYLYGKGIAGNCHFDNLGIRWFGNTVVEGYYLDRPYEGSNKNYWGAGIGFGYKKEFHRLFMCYNIGYKYTFLKLLNNDEKGEYENFFVSGPGAYLDLNATFGIRLSK